MEGDLADRHNILIVDDEVATVRAIERTLRREYNVFSATNGRDALAIMEQRDIALILVDYRMPGMTGVELLERVMQKYPNIIRLILTGYPTEELFMAAINRLRVHGFFTKPWDPEEMESNIRKWVGLYSEMISSEGKTKKQLMAELVELRRQLTDSEVERKRLEASMAERKRMEEKRSLKIGEILVEMGYLTLSQLQRALQKQEEVDVLGQKHKMIGVVLLESGIITLGQLQAALDLQLERLRYRE